MKSYLFCLVIALTTFTVTAQPGEKKIAYLDKDFNEIADPQAATYYRTVQSTFKGYTVRDYFIDGQIEMVAECSEYMPLIVRNGNVKNFYKNGNIKEEGSYKKGLPAGEFTYFSENGKPEKRLEQGVGPKTRHLQYYTPDGRELLAGGQGILTDTNDAGDTIYSRIKNYELVSCYRVISASDTIFLIVEKQAMYPGGIPAMMEYLQHHMKYPKQARRDRIEGTVYVSFVVDKAGKVSEPHVVKGIGAECDAEAIRVIGGFPDWEPGIERGKIMSSRFVLPIKFRLAGNRRG